MNSIINELFSNLEISNQEGSKLTTVRNLKSIKDHDTKINVIIQPQKPKNMIFPFSVM